MSQTEDSRVFSGILTVGPGWGASLAFTFLNAGKKIVQHEWVEGAGDSNHDVHTGFLRVPIGEISDPYGVFVLVPWKLTTPRMSSPNGEALVEVFPRDTGISDEQAQALLKYLMTFFKEGHGG